MYNLRVVEGYAPSLKKVTTIKQWAPSSTIVWGVGLGLGLGLGLGGLRLEIGTIQISKHSSKLIRVWRCV